MIGPFSCFWRASNVFTRSLNGFGQSSNQILLLRNIKKKSHMANFKAWALTFFVTFWLYLILNKQNILKKIAFLVRMAKMFFGERIRLVWYCCIGDSLDRSWNMAHMQGLERVQYRALRIALECIWWDLHRIIAWVFLVAAFYRLGHFLRERLGLPGALNMGRCIGGYSDVLLYSWI
jgi:hypothetical protein